jgi:hypothetical protein
MLITAAHKTQTPSSTGKKVGAVFALVGTEGVDLDLHLVVIDGLSLSRALDGHERMFA